MAVPHQLLGPSDREAITDVLYRAALGIDTNDQDLWDSAWISREGASISFDGHVMQGESVQKVLENIGPMDTSHHVSNVRVSLRDNAQKASATALGLHQHYRHGEGLDPEKAQFLLAARRYSCEFVKVEGSWKMTMWGFKTVWDMGTKAVMPF